MGPQSELRHHKGSFRRVRRVFHQIPTRRKQNREGLAASLNNWARRCCNECLANVRHINFRPHPLFPTVLLCYLFFVFFRLRPGLRVVTETLPNVGVGQPSLRNVALSRGTVGCAGASTFIAYAGLGLCIS